MTGTLTFVFTDIEGSTRRWQRFGDAMRAALERHDAIVADVVEDAGGQLFKHTGDGVCSAFGSCTAALEAAVGIQRRLAAERWDDVDGLAVRIGIHTGEATARDGDFFGPTLNRAARVMEAAHGGQVLVSDATAALTRAVLPPGAALADVGEHPLRDLEGLEHLHQLVADGLRREFPPPRTAADGRPTPVRALPVSRTSFVGRAGEIERVVELLEGRRLVTLVGIGGTGKTRLAIEAVAAAPTGHRTATFVDLAPLTDGTQLPSQVAGALGIAGGGLGTGAILDTVVAALSTGHRLLVLDNCEHLVDTCAELVDALLDGCPDLTILATSREALAVEGEAIVAVGSLPVAEASDLFVERAGLEGDAARDPAIAEICERLDGIPLAIELAASRAGHLEPAVLAARLDDRFRLLTGGRQRRAQRQQTLQAAIDWSHDLLDDAERALLRRLSIFTGGFTLEAAEQACAGAPVEADAVVELLGSLVAKSLVLVDRSPRTRYRLLETIRLYAAGRLVAAGEAEAFRERHRDWVLGWLHGIDLDDLVTRGDLPVDEIENVRAAIDWSEATGRGDAAAEITYRTAYLWVLSGHHDEGAIRLGALVARDDLSDESRARCLSVLSLVHMTIGDFDRMDDAARRSLALEPDGPLAPIALVQRALYLVFDVDGYPAAHALFENARRIAAAQGLPRQRQLADAVEAHFCVVEGEYDRVTALAAVAPQPSFSDLNIRLAAHAAHILRGEPDRAAEEIMLLHPVWADWSHSVYGLALLEQGRRDDAIASMARGARVFVEKPFPLVISDCLLAFAALALFDGDPARGAEILSSTVAERGLASFRSPAAAMLSRRYVRAARDRLSDAEYAQARQRGRRMDPREVFDVELARLATNGAGPPTA